MAYRNQDNITFEIAEIMDKLELDRLPTRGEIKLVTGSEALDHAIKRNGGRSYYAKRLNTHTKGDRVGFRYKGFVKPCKVCGKSQIWFSRDKMVNAVCVNCGNGVFNYDSTIEAAAAWNYVNTKPPTIVSVEVEYADRTKKY